MTKNNDLYSRTELLLGEENINKIKNATVMICGVGGVGGYVAESLVRLGVGKIVFIDSDKTDVTNLNRQILATKETIGVSKVISAVNRANSINENGKFIPLELFLTPENIPALLDKYKPSCVADAIDNITAKISLAVECEKRNIPIISSMGTGNKTDPTRFVATDIYKTTVCPLARTMRRLLKEKGIKKLRVVYSDEQPIKCGENIGTLPFVPAAAGMIISSEVMKKILENPKDTQF
ncbi:MAG: tRNA threonylcarbamoyladenosine dehydratase [Ruminococcaceae bacterium]|nr:tRNA threonylcarbamoyladenosine dehydratase [Oscillospiraceae bacterium]